MNLDAESEEHTQVVFGDCSIELTPENWHKVQLNYLVGRYNCFNIILRFISVSLHQLFAGAKNKSESSARFLRRWNQREDYKVIIDYMSFIELAFKFIETFTFRFKKISTTVASEIWNDYQVPDIKVE